MEHKKVAPAWEYRNIFKYSFGINPKKAVFLVSAGRGSSYKYTIVVCFDAP
jgi:hypothetical protein